MSVIAVYPMTNWGGIEIAEINEESVTYRYNFGEPEAWHLTDSHDGEWFTTYTGTMVEICEVCGVGF